MSEFSGQRRLTTILAADVVGYSAHMSADEEATLSQLKRHLAVIDPLVEAKQGRIFHQTGDGFLAEFPSALEAVRSAIEIQETVARNNLPDAIEPKLQFRLGINVGDVIDQDGNLYGDGVNIAARLEGLAAPGGICVSSGVYELVKNKLSYSFTSIGEQRVKNIPEPITTFALMPVTAVADTGMSVEHQSAPTSEPIPNRSRRSLIWSVAALTAFVVSLLIAYPYLSSTQTSESDETATVQITDPGPDNQTTTQKPTERVDAVSTPPTDAPIASTTSSDRDTIQAAVDRVLGNTDRDERKRELEQERAERKREQQEERLDRLRDAREEREERKREKD